MEMIQGLNKKDIIIMVANDMSFIPYFTDAFGKYYSEHRIELYEKAKTNKDYNDEWFSNKRLGTEISMRRIFSVLLTAEEKQETLDFVLSTIEGYPITKNLITALKNNDINQSIKIFEKEMFSNNENIINNIFLSLFGYCLQTYKIDTVNLKENYATILNAFENVIQSRLQNDSKRIKMMENSTIHDKITIIRECRKVFESFECGNDILAIQDLGKQIATASKNFLSVLSNGLDLNTTPEISTLLKTEFNEYSGREDIVKTIYLLNEISSKLSCFGFSLSAMIEDIPLTKEDKNIIVKTIAINKADIYGVGASVFLYDYVLNSVIYLLAKVFNETRTFYFQNNSESEFFELSRYIKENKMLSDDLIETREKVETLLQENNILNQLNNNLQTSISTTENNNEHFKKLENSYFKEIELLKSKISSLEETIKENENERQELYRLRELAFDIQHNDIGLPNHKPLEELLEGKKVILIGGHINIRNKLIEKYPALTVLDGHNPNIEESLIMNADLVIFNTSNMSHKVYEKIIKVLRTHEGKFDYVGRVMNMEKLDNEIATLIEKNI